jgi:hypothetical protein
MGASHSFAVLSMLLLHTVCPSLVSASAVRTLAERSAENGAAVLYEYRAALHLGHVISMVYGACCMMYCTWCMSLAWCMVHAV